MSPIIRIAELVLVVCVFMLAPERCRAESDPPNFIIIFIDDLGYGDLSCYGAPQIKTPNLDRMASEGLRFTSFYSCACVCTPSRAGLMTGRYPIRNGLTRVLFPGSKDGIEDSEITLAEVLKQRGYLTTCIGKWHLGHLPQYLPTRHGFDSYYGIPYSNDMFVEKRGDPPIPLMRNEETIEQPADQDTLTKRYTEEAIRFIETNKDKPFFLYLPHSMVHVPLHVSKDFAGHSVRGLYGDAVEEVDWSVGELLSALKRNGLDDNTLVIFTSDNGPWLIQKEDGGSAGPLREGKGTTFEGGVREPCIMRWPGKIALGQTTDEPAITLDLLPTLAALAGGTAPSGRTLDGRDIQGMLFGNGHRADQEFFFYRGEVLEAHRSGPWKLKRAFKGEVRGQSVDDPVFLFNLEQDMSESTNLAAQHPEIVARLEKEMVEFEKGLGIVPATKK